MTAPRSCPLHSTLLVMQAQVVACSRLCKRGPIIVTGVPALSHAIISSDQLKDSAAAHAVHGSSYAQRPPRNGYTERRHSIAQRQVSSQSCYMFNKHRMPVVRRHSPGMWILIAQ